MSEMPARPDIEKIEEPLERRDYGGAGMRYYFISIDYDEGDQTSYRAVEVHESHTVVTRFDTGDFMTDWAAFEEWVAQLQPGDYLGLSSTVDSFFMDGDTYQVEWAE